MADKLKFVKAGDGMHEVFVEQHDLTYRILQNPDGDWKLERSDLGMLGEGMTFAEAKTAAQGDFDAYVEGNAEVVALQNENDDESDDELGQVAETRDGANDPRTAEEAQSEEDAQIVATEKVVEAPKKASTKVKLPKSDKLEFTATFNNGESKTFHSVDAGAAKYRAYRIARDTEWTTVPHDANGKVIGVKVTKLVDKDGNEVK